MDYIFLATSIHRDNAPSEIKKSVDESRKHLINDLGCAVSVYSKFIVPDYPSARKVNFFYSDDSGRDNIYEILQRFKFTSYSCERKLPLQLNMFVGNTLKRAGNNMVIFGDVALLNGVCDVVQTEFKLNKELQFYDNVLDAKLFNVKSKEFRSVLGQSEDDTNYVNAYLAMQHGKHVIEGYFKMIDKSTGMMVEEGVNVIRKFKDYKTKFGLK